MKECSQCKELKELDCFSKDKYKKSGYRAYCKSCEKKYYNNKAKERHAKYREENREEIRKKNKIHRSNNIQKRREDNKKWRSQSKDKIKAIRIRRRKNLLKANGTLDKEKIKERFKYYENKCYYCKQSSNNLQMDHRIPLSRGGSNWPSNIVPSCLKCNSTKGSKTEKEFIIYNSW